MRIAVAYENGQVFQHFGRTEQFKVYDIEDGAVVSAEVIGSDGIGHGALAGLLAERGVETVICGGLGEGAQAALRDAGVEVISGAEGDADAAVAAYLKGELVSTGANCDHHEHEHEHEEAQACGDSGCGGGGCAGCSGCGPVVLTLEGPNAGKLCRVHYVGTFDDGTTFDSSYDRGEPLEFVCGAGMMIRGFDRAVVDMQPGEVIDIHLMPEEAYGMRDPAAVFKAEIAMLPGSEKASVGDQVYLMDPSGRPFIVSVIDKDETTITFDANHEMAGKELNFRIELLEVK